MLANHEIVLSALGGTAALCAMIGAHSFVSLGGEGVMFAWKARGCAGPLALAAKANKVVVTVNETGTLNLEFFRVGRGALSVKRIASFAGVAPEKLRGYFETATGLRVSVPRVVGVNA